MKLLHIILSLLISFITLSHAKTLEETVKKQFDFQSGSKITLKNQNGRVEIEGWDKNEVYLLALKRVEADSEEEAKEIMAHVEIEIDESDGELYIRTRTPKNNGGFWDNAFGRSVSVNVQYTLQVPRNCNLRIQSTNGSVEAANVSGDIRLESTNGKIRANDISGELQAHTTNGGIRAEMTSVDNNGEMDFTTTNGSIKLYLPSEAAFDVKAKTTNGSIDSDFHVASEREYNRRRLEGSVNGGGVRLYLKTTNGSIDIRER